jgi:hypothetical protein
MDFDQLKLRALKHRGDRPGQTYKANDGSLYNIAAVPIAGAPHVARVSVDRVDKKGKPLEQLGDVDVHFAAGQDLDALILKNAKQKILGAAGARKAREAVAETLAKWGAAEAAEAGRV